MTNDTPSATKSLAPAGRPERVDYFRPAAVPGTEMLAACDSSRPWRVFHERYALCSCHAAAAGWRYRGKQHFLEDGSSMLLEPGEMHVNTRVHKPSDFKALFIEPELFVRMAEELGVSGTPHFRFAQSEDRGLSAAHYEFCASVAADAIALEQQSIFAVCLRRMFGYIERVPRGLTVGYERQSLERAREYVHERFHESVRLDELVAVTGLSRFHLLRSFARRFGLPPHAYQIRLRVERASALLRTGMPPSVVASVVGFADQSHFTRHMRRIMCVTPARYAHPIKKPRLAAGL